MTSLLGIELSYSFYRLPKSLIIPIKLPLPLYRLF